MDSATKDLLTARFRAYLDAADEAPEEPLDDDLSADVAGDAAGVAIGGEPLDGGVPATDLFNLFAEVAALKNEVKLEARQVKLALDDFRALFDALDAAQAQASAAAEGRAEQERASAAQARKAHLLELLELRDRLQDGHERAAGYRGGWFGSGDAADYLADLAEHLGATLRRLDEVLARYGVRPFLSVQRTFDAQTMHAAELAADPMRPEGQVLAELRKGFFYEDELLRPAEVLVNQVSQAAEERLAGAGESRAERRRRERAEQAERKAYERQVEAERKAREQQEKTERREQALAEKAARKVHQRTGRRRY